MSEHAPLAGSGPGGEKLLAAHLMLSGLSEMVPVDETGVALALDRLWLTLETARDWETGLYTMLRTASYYILDANESQEAIASMPPALPSFPPLPFRRVWIEVAKTERGRHSPAPYAEWAWDDPKFPGLIEHMEILGIAISEVTRGREWQIFLPHKVSYEFDGETKDQDAALIASAREREGVRVMAFHITPHEILAPKQMVKGTSWHAGHLQPLLQLAINGAHLITARGVPHHEFRLPRGQRKRLDQQRYAPNPPKMYYVDLTRAGEEMDEAPSSREYHVRWLVSGHWRHLDHATELCTCPEHHLNPQPATYIEPYVKGPPNAPWKGRPVHRQVAS